MIQSIRTSKFSKVIASYLAIQLMLTTVQPSNLFALTGGPSQPEFNSFTPIGTSDMVNLSSGDFNYNIPIMDVGGYPLNLAYNSGITMDQEASWVGLGWNLNVGQIARNVRGIPDDFKGDEIRYENDMRDNVTVGANFNIQPGVFGKDIPLNLGLGLGVQYNNYEGISWKPSYGLTYAISDNVNVGFNISSSTADGASVSPSVSLSKKTGKSMLTTNTASGNLGVTFNSRKGLENMSLSVSGRKTEMRINKKDEVYDGKTNGSIGGNISFNDQSYTPSKRAGLKNGNFSFSAGVGLTFMGADAQGRITGYGSYQKIRNSEKSKLIESFGYEHTEANEGLNGVLDFNREKDKSFNKNTRVLPITNYTYDIYAIQGQGASGQFRPFRSQTSYVYDSKVTDYGAGGSFGLEFDVGNLVHTGFDIKVSPSTSWTGKWSNKNFALPKFIEKESDQNPLAYEPVYFQTVGELGLDPEPKIYTDDLHANSALKIQLAGSKYNRKALPQFSVKSINDGSSGTEGTAVYTSNTIGSTIKRTKRKKRNQSIHKVTVSELRNAHEGDYALSLINEHAEEHHTAKIEVLKPDGSTYNFGKTAYNTKKVEATFDMSGSNSVDCSTGIISNIGSNGDPRRSLNSSDKFLNRITTPPYAHTYLLSSVLSSDYEDIDGNGPTPGDLGAYTLFSYKTHDDDYKWRVPYNTNEASYNEGLKSKYNDQKGNYLYGEKELVYIDKIETKTHVALFKLINREDGRGAKGETSNVSTAGYQKAIDKIYLFSKPEFDFYVEQNGGSIDIDNSGSELEELAIKVAHFEYNYSLCPGVPNNLNGGGKLTLEKVYFTYRGSNMGRYTPYIFNYNNLNPSYNLKGYDVWGNYKENSINAGCNANDPITAAEFPYTDQYKTTADDNAKAWTLTSINLPSGGELVIETEADDYQYVQNRKVMQMFNVTGAGNTDSPSESQAKDAVLYNGESHRNYIYAKISDEIELGLTIDDIIGDQIDKPIQFRMLLNMTNNRLQRDYVTGYFEIDQAKDTNIFTLSDGTYVALPLQFIEREGGFVNSDKMVNPIAKAGWYFGRTYLNREVYSLGGSSTSNDFGTVVGDLISSLPSVIDIFSGPNGKLQGKGCARVFNPEKSWVRLLNPTKRKLGGGLRVTKIEMHDNWNAMTSNDGIDLYKQFYGQEYNYNNEDGNSSGVATFEPASSKENPFIEPVYNRSDTARDKLTAPRESNYTEKPLGESFFPSPTVTYGRVEVKNLQRKMTDGDNTIVLKKHATGKVVNEFYTSFDFPTITDHTDIQPMYPDNEGALSNILNISVRNHLTMSQGFVVETNDMNGKMKRQRIYAEGQNSAISGVDYNYSVNEDNTLKNNLPTINKDGVISEEGILGMHYDVVNDFRESNSSSKTYGVNTNFTAFLAAIIPGFVVLPVPQYARHENILRTAVTTKVIHKTGILKEKVAYDLGAKVSTENLAWDASTGQVLLTKTLNEYDNAYYNFNYPAYWYYDGMGFASENLGINVWIESTSLESNPNELGDTDHADNPNIEGIHKSPQGSAWYKLSYYPNINLRDNFSEGDEVVIQNSFSGETHFWINEINENGNKFILINRNGEIESPCGDDEVRLMKVIRSHKRNLQFSSMASITSMVNPIEDGVLDDNDFQYDGTGINPMIVNASAIEYQDFWKPQIGMSLVSYPNSDLVNDLIPYPNYGANPFVNNIKGDWRAVKSYAYLTGRNSDGTLNSDGFFTDFNPFYTYKDVTNDGIENPKWEKQSTDWTFASEVTQYSPYGAELENKDALKRYSAAQYNYDETLPVAVVSNSEYREMGFQNFEDYDSSQQSSSNHFVGTNARSGLNIIDAHTGKMSGIIDDEGGYFNIIVPVGDNFCEETNNELANNLCEAPVEGCIVSTNKLLDRYSDSYPETNPGPYIEIFDFDDLFENSSFPGGVTNVEVDLGNIVVKRFDWEYGGNNGTTVIDPEVIETPFNCASILVDDDSISFDLINCPYGHLDNENSISELGDGTPWYDGFSYMASIPISYDRSDGVRCTTIVCFSTRNVLVDVTLECPN